jgi:glycosyltransferase involved in cell wall biosynthesis
MTRICHFSSAHQGLDIRIYRKQCLSLARAGFDTHLVIAASAAEIAEAATHGVAVHPLAPARGRLGRILFQSWRCYRRARALDAEVYHFHDPELIPYGLLLHWQGKKVIIDLHEDLRGDIHSKHWIPPMLRRAIGTAARRLEHAAARRLSAVVAATPFIGKLFEHSAGRLAIIHNYPMVDELADAPSPGQAARDCVCYVGAIDDIRGIREAVRALETVDCKLLLAGRFGSAALREEVGRYPGWLQVEECGFVDRARVAQIMARSFCGLVTFHPVPNHIHSLPIKLFEYMSAGVPVIASDFPLWRQIIEDADCGLCVDPNQPEQIAAAINHLRANPALAKKMGNNGRRAVETKYRWDREAVTLVALYGQVAAVPGPANTAPARQ